MKSTAFCLLFSIALYLENSSSFSLIMGKFNCLKVQLRCNKCKNKVFYKLSLSSVSLCFSKLSCKQGHSGPTYESMQAVFDLQSFRPAVNLSNPTITNISFTLYAVLGVVSSSISNLRKIQRAPESRFRTSTIADIGNVRQFKCRSTYVGSNKIVKICACIT